MWPYEENDFMEMGDSGWVPIGQGSYLNKYTGHTVDEIGREFDEKGNLIYDPNEVEQEYFEQYFN